MVKGTDTEFTHIQMVQFMKAIGPMVKSTEKEK